MSINYEILVNKAMYQVIKDALEIASEKSSFDDDHGIFISFITKSEGVQLSRSVKTKYPDEMTILLQHQFSDLKVYSDKFSVCLSFNGKEEVVVVPFGAITSYVDSLANFALNFKKVEYDSVAANMFMEIMDYQKGMAAEHASDATKSGKSKAKKSAKIAKISDNVIYLDRFRGK